MLNKHFSRKERQLKNHVFKLKGLIEKNNDTLSSKINKHIVKIKELINILRGVLSSKKLKYILGSFAFLLGINTNEIKAQSFSVPSTNPFGINLNSNIGGYYYAGKTQFVDMDNDGDLDLLYETQEINTGYYSYYSNTVFIYHENLGTNTNPQFSNGVKNPFNLSSPQNFSLYGSLLSHNVIDLDNDGDYDILASFSGLYPYYNYSTGYYNYDVNTVFKYYENVGNPSIPLFSAQQNNPFGLSIDSIIGLADVVDIDGDGDYDVICSSAILTSSGIQNQKMLFIENVGTQSSPQFNTPQLNSFGITNPSSMYPVIPSFGDIDGDGDYDLLTTPYLDGNIAYEFKYQQNKGSTTNPMLSFQTTNPFGLTPDTSYAGIIINSEMIDLDGDGDLDIIASGFQGDSFLYFENGRASTSLSNTDNNYINVFPNPTSEILTVNSNFSIGLIEIVDKIGKVKIVSENSNKLNVSNLNKGTYIINIYYEDKKISKKFVKY